MVKNLPAMQEIQVQSLDWEDPVEEGTATNSSILAWRIHAQRSLVGGSGPCDFKELDITEVTEHACRHRIVVVHGNLSK